MIGKVQKKRRCDCCGRMRTESTILRYLPTPNWDWGAEKDHPREKTVFKNCLKTGRKRKRKKKKTNKTEQNCS